MARAGRRRAQRLTVEDLLRKARAHARPITAAERPGARAEPGKADFDSDEHRARLERRAREAARAQLRASARIRWAAIVVAGLAIVVGIALPATMSRPAPRNAALSAVPLQPAATLASSASAVPDRSTAPSTATRTSTTPTPSTTRPSAAPPPVITTARHCPTNQTVTLNDDSDGIGYRGSWNVSRDREFGDFHADVHYTKTNGSWVDYSFSGTGIALFSETFSDEGRMDVYLDEVFQRTVDTTSDVRRAQQAVFSACALPPGRHTIRAVKRSGTYMLVDRFDVTP
ncbi:hypothetical protein [Amycolatopsis kentuckyensis]|uniref:hypothetical protein n=1 Tax=Amycolatopsis kentuckyensis TaxID=218823 RepID=UPI00356560CE